jgi:hypothetical protein
MRRCTPTGTRRYGEGEAFLEGADYLHEAVNDGNADVVLWLVYVEPYDPRGIQQATRSR